MQSAVPLKRKLLALELSFILERCPLRKKSPKKPTATIFRCLSYTLRHLFNKEKAYFILNSLETHWRPALSLWIEKCVLHLKRN